MLRQHVHDQLHSNLAVIAVHAAQDGARYGRRSKSMSMVSRNVLPQRRLCETLDVWHAGQRYHVSIGRFHDGALAEIFINSGRSGSDLEAITKDAAVALSIALQYGVPLAPIIRA